MHGTTRRQGNAETRYKVALYDHPAGLTLDLHPTPQRTLPAACRRSKGPRYIHTTEILGLGRRRPPGLAGVRSDGECRTAWRVAADSMRLQPTTASRAKGTHMAELQETRKEQETRWAAQRVAYEKELHGSQAARRQRTVRNLIVAVIVLIVVVVVAVVLL